MKKHLLIGIAVVLCFLVITNPPLGAFKDYTGKKTGLTKRYNFFVCSIYSDGEEYVGILGNFFLIKHAPKAQVYSQYYCDSTSCSDCIDVFGKSNTSTKRNKLKDTDINKALNDYIK